MDRPPPSSTLFPYTTLFRSGADRSASAAGAVLDDEIRPHALVQLLHDQPRHDVDRAAGRVGRSEEHTSELQSRRDIVCRLLLEKKKTDKIHGINKTARYTDH